MLLSTERKKKNGKCNEELSDGEELGSECGRMAG
jgi:hypothetical protein